MQQDQRSREYYVWLIAAILGVGAVLQFLLWARQSLLADQVMLLQIGVDFVESGTLAPVGKGMSGHGMIPGSFLQLVIGLPLRVWRDYRAPGLLIVISHFVAVAIVALTFGRAMGLRFLAIFLVLYWLSPWHIAHSGFLWEPNLLLLPAAIHLGASYASRAEKKWLPSAVLTTTLVLTLQVHASFVILVIASAYLVWRRLIKLDFRGAIAGVVVGSLTLIPTAAAFVGGRLPRIAPGRGDDVPALLMPFANGFKALLYWLRLGSADVGRRLRGTLYLADGWPGEAPLIPLPGFVVWGFVIAAGAGIAFAAVASWKYVRTARANSGRDPLDDRAWLRAYAFAFFVAVVGGSAISPVTIQGWHVVIALLAALIPVAFLVQHALDSTRRAWRVAALAFLVVQICVSLLVASGNTMFMGRLEPPIDDPAFPESVKPYVSHKGPRGTA